MGNREKTVNFEDLEVWQQAIKLSKTVYQISSKFPKSEMYGLTNQIRRAVNSISANIAEGYGRRNLPEKAQFYKIAYGSALETKNFIYLSVELGFYDSKLSDAVLSDIVVIQKGLNALISSVNNSAK